MPTVELLCISIAQTTTEQQQSFHASMKPSIAMVFLAGSDQTVVARMGGWRISCSHIPKEALGEVPLLQGGVCIILE